MIAVYSPVNCAWLILWGTGPIADRHVIGIRPTKAEALDEIRWLSEGGAK